MPGEHLDTSPRELFNVAWQLISLPPFQGTHYVPSHMPLQMFMIIEAAGASLSCFVFTNDTWRRFFAHLHSCRLEAFLFVCWAADAFLFPLTSSAKWCKDPGLALLNTTPHKFDSVALFWEHTEITLFFFVLT